MLDSLHSRDYLIPFTQLRIYHTITGTNIVLDMYKARFREDVVTVDVENDGCLCVSKRDVVDANFFPAGATNTVTNSSQRRLSATTPETL
jgi:hypothetical protein